MAHLGGYLIGGIKRFALGIKRPHGKRVAIPPVVVGTLLNVQNPAVVVLHPL